MKLQFIFNIKITVTLLFLISISALAQKEIDTSGSFYFSVEHEIKATSIKQQGLTGTCWSFATTSFIESEAMRKGADAIDLSEMYFVRYAYPEKALLYINSQGKNVFSNGGLAHDVLNIVADYGCVPENNYDGDVQYPNLHNHNEMHSVLTSMVRTIVKQKNQSSKWFYAFNSVINTYIGVPPEYFIYNKKIYTPIQFCKIAIDFNPDDYVEITSFTNNNFYSKYYLDIPDNWLHSEYYNIKLDELIQVVDSAIQNGYSVVWDGDVSENEFKMGKGIAIWPKKRWADKSKKEKTITCIEFEKEKMITQELRQKSFEDGTTTDDHLMHIIGIAKDQKGNKYYKIKNSWGVNSNIFGGYLYMSEAYMRMKTINIMLHKEAIPKSIAKKIQF